MKKSRLLPGRLCFPLSPVRIDRVSVVNSLPVADAVGYLADILSWREAVRTALVTGDPAIDVVDHLTPRARKRLAVMLESKWDARTRHWAATTTNGLMPFPSIRLDLPTDDPATAVLDVLHWRGGVVNYLTDVWDSMSTPELDMGECAAIGAFMRPVRLQGRCVYCLNEYPADRIDPEDHGCVIVGDRVSLLGTP